MTVIIGAGISGLVTAWYLDKQHIPYVILEAENHAGGYLQTLKTENYLLELAANSLLCDEELINMLHDFGLEDAIIYPKPVSKARYIYKDNRFKKLPTSPPALLASSFFSWKTKWNILCELFINTHTHPQESLAAFFTRRFGKEIVDYALTPFVSGIYAGDPTQLSVQKTFPSLVKHEQEYGSVIKGLIKSKNNKRKQSLSFQNGMQQLPTTIAQKLSIEYNTKVLEIQESNNALTIKHSNGTINASKVVLCTPAHTSATLLQNIDPEISKKLDSISSPPMTVVHSVFRKSDIGVELNGFGVLHPAIENTFSAGSIWTSSVFDERCPKNEVLLTSFVGGELFKKQALFAQETIKKHLTQELMDFYAIKQPPIFQHLTQWQKTIPQYNNTNSYLSLDENIIHLQNIDIEVCANWYGGISVGDCMKKGKQTAQKLIQLQNK